MFGFGVYNYPELPGTDVTVLFFAYAFHRQVSSFNTPPIHGLRSQFGRTDSLQAAQEDADVKTDLGILGAEQKPRASWTNQKLGACRTQTHSQSVGLHSMKDT